MSIPINLPMIEVTSLERQFSHKLAAYSVTFEGKSQDTSKKITVWCISLRENRNAAPVQYIFHKEKGHWTKTIGINSMPEEIEEVFLPWAAAILARHQLRTSGVSKPDIPNQISLISL
ncbi:MAG TPA: hypothetical protein VG052_15060 [Puia sp.]|jgi:hypothetical protein|nr:hypothetical protein [Puia sp.]